MEVVLIDSFIVPEDAKAEFIQQAYQSQEIVKTLPGFVEGYIYEYQTGDSPYSVVTTAVWESSAALANAKRLIGEVYQKQGFNPQAVIQRLGVQMIRATYDRHPY